MTLRLDPTPAVAADAETQLLAVAAGIAVAAAFALILAGAVSGLVFGSGWAWPPSDQWGRIVHAAVTHPDHPATGWPPPLARRLPPAGAYWATYLTLIAAAAAPALLVWSRLAGRRPGPGRDGLAAPASSAVKPPLERRAGAARSPGRPWPAAVTTLPSTAIHSAGPPMEVSVCGRRGNRRPG